MPLTNPLCDKNCTRQLHVRVYFKNRLNEMCIANIIVSTGKSAVSLIYSMCTNRTKTVLNGAEVKNM